MGLEMVVFDLVGVEILGWDRNGGRGWVRGDGGCGGVGDGGMDDGNGGGG